MGLYGVKFPGDPKTYWWYPALITLNKWLPRKPTAAEKVHAKVEERQDNGLAKSETNTELVFYGPTNDKGERKHRWVTEAEFEECKTARSLNKRVVHNPPNPVVADKPSVNQPDPSAPPLEGELANPSAPPLPDNLNLN